MRAATALCVVATCDLCERAIMPQKAKLSRCKKMQEAKKLLRLPTSPPAGQSPPLSSLALSRLARGLQIQTQTCTHLCQDTHVGV